ALILLGNDDGTFAQLSGLALDSTSDALATGDFNADGRIDLAVAVQCEEPGFCSRGSVAVYMGSGDGTFAAPSRYSVGVRPNAVAAGDFTGDGTIDLVSINKCRDQYYNCDGADVTLLVGQGDGT